jgi:hypothetical protein
VVVCKGLRLVALRIPTVTARGHQDDEGVIKPVGERGYADLALQPVRWSGRVRLIARHLSLKPYWGKPNVRNFREDAGNVDDGRTRNPLRNRKSGDRKLPA